MAVIKLHDILWQTKNGGASPDDNRRTELYFAGCRKALSGNPCKNCFNPETWNFNYGSPFTVHTEDEVLAYMEPDYIKGITLLGGDPVEPERPPQPKFWLKRLTVGILKTVIHAENVRIVCVLTMKKPLTLLKSTLPAITAWMRCGN